MVLFVIRMASGESITVDGEFTIGDNGVLSVARTQRPQVAIATTHFSPAAWVSVEAVVHQPLAASVHTSRITG